MASLGKCISCKLSRGVMYNIFEENIYPVENAKNLAELIQQGLSVRLNKSKHYSNEICERCIHGMEHCRKITQRARENQEWLRENLGPDIPLPRGYTFPDSSDDETPNIVDHPTDKKPDTVLENLKKEKDVGNEITNESNEPNSEKSDTVEIKNVLENLKIDVGNEITNESKESVEINSEKNESKKEVITLDSFICRHCDKAFKNHEDVPGHEASHDSFYSNTCNFCKWKGNHRNVLIAHLRAKHNKKKPYICTICKHALASRADLKNHIAKHSGFKPFTCDDCGKKFVIKSNWTKHKKTHFNAEDLSEAK